MGLAFRVGIQALCVDQMGVYGVPFYREYTGYVWFRE